MNGEIRQVVAPRPGAIKLIVELVSKPGDRVGVADGCGGKGPLHVRPVQTAQNVFVFRDVVVVVVVNESTPDHGPVNRAGDDDQRYRN